MAIASHVYRSVQEKRVCRGRRTMDSPVRSDHIAKLIMAGSVPSQNGGFPRGGSGASSSDNNPAVYIG